MPCEIENDVNCAGLAEAVSGSGKGASVTLCLTIGTGIGGCLI
ncbi:ROK family protein, partial [Burkholderia cenocepacia]|nr:ROK family protein [Burkholderia cenocepacia]